MTLVVATEASEHDFRLLVDGIEDYGIIMLDTTGCVLTWNRGAERMNGFRAAEIIGRHFSAFYPAEDIAAHKPELELKVARETGRFEEEGWRLRKDGEPLLGQRRHHRAARRPGRRSAASARSRAT